MTKIPYEERSAKERNDTTFHLPGNWWIASLFAAGALIVLTALAYGSAASIPECKDIACETARSGDQQNDPMKFIDEIDDAEEAEKQLVRLIGPPKLTNLHTVGGCAAAGLLLDEIIKGGAKVQIFGAEGLVCRAHVILRNNKPDRGHNIVVVIDYKDGTHAVAYGNWSSERRELCAVDEASVVQRHMLRKMLLEWKRVKPDNCGDCALERAAKDWCLNQ